MTQQFEGEVPRRILLVDDIELTRTLTETVLRAAAYDVDSVADGEAAVLALDSKVYDLVLMDLDTPGIGGHAAAAAMQRRERDPIGRFGTPTIVALSSRSTPDARERSRLVGMADHIRRPIGPAELIEEVARLLSQCQTEARTWVREPYIDLVDRLGQDSVRLLLSSLLSHCQAMRSAIAEPGTPAASLRRSAHDLVSVGGMLGFEALSSACFVLQSDPDGDSFDIAARRVDGALEAAISLMASEVATCSAMAA